MRSKDIFLGGAIIRFSVVVRDQVGTGEVELLWGVFQNIGQLRYQLGQLNGFLDLVLSNTEKFSDQFTSIIPLTAVSWLLRQGRQLVRGIGTKDDVRCKVDAGVRMDDGLLQIALSAAPRFSLPLLHLGAPLCSSGQRTAPRSYKPWRYLCFNRKYILTSKRDGICVFLVTQRRFELRTPCLKGRCSAD